MRPEPPSPRDGDPEVGTFVLADLAGYTALTEAHGDRQAAQMADEFFGAVRDIAREYDAQEVKTIGDAVLLRLTDAAHAVHLAARTVNDFGARHRTLGVCAGLHTGTAVRRGDDWFGAAVNVASRVAGVARAGEVLLTADTRDAAGEAIAASQLTPRGAHELKNVRERVELFALLPQDPEAAPLPVDPVCRMSVDPDRAAETADHRGVVYCFCSPECRKAFDAEPDRYAAAPGGGAIGRTWRRLTGRG